MTKTVFCTFQVAGFHHWPDAPNRYAYLQDDHRHVFHGRVEVYVGGDNREVEFIELKRQAEDAFRGIAESTTYDHTPDFGFRSCEQLVAELKSGLSHYAVAAIEISEDGENGARATFDLPAR